MSPGIRKFLTIALFFIGFFLSARYILPLLLPFLLGSALALTAEPLVAFFCRRAKMPRTLAAGLGVTMAFCVLVLLVMVLCGLFIRQLGLLADILPQIESSLLTGISALSQWLLGLADRAPEGIRGFMTQTVTDLFSGSSALLERITGFLLSLASGILSRVPDQALSFGTAIIASYMISAKLPKIRNILRSRLPRQRLEPLKSTLTRLKTTVLCWLSAQLKLTGVTFILLTAGFFLLDVPYAPLCALLVSLVDAFPVLGTGTVLVPWSLIAFVQGSRFLAFGLLGLYVLVTLSRSVLEPKLLGKHLGLDPLVTLIALYAGYRLWGLVGMILSPILAVTAVQLAADSRQT